MLPDRAYTLDEIDHLRKAARTWYGLYSNFDAPELEQRIRTLMVAGISPQDLEAAVRLREQISRKKKRDG